MSSADWHQEAYDLHTGVSLTYDEGLIHLDLYCGDARGPAFVTVSLTPYMVRTLAVELNRWADQEDKE